MIFNILKFDDKKLSSLLGSFFIAKKAFLWYNIAVFKGSIKWKNIIQVRMN
jgi:hypothetical protein